MKHEKGNPLPLGGHLIGADTNISMMAKDAKRVTILLQNHEIPMTRTGDCWHIRLINTHLPLHYIFRVDGGQPILDPYAKVVNSPSEWMAYMRPYHPVSEVPKEEPFDWEGVPKPQLAMKDLIIYEMHVRGFTEHPSSGVKHPGRFLGIIEKIPYLLELGVNAIELMPILEFNEKEYQHSCNYWGYSPVSYFALMNRYGTVQEFKQLVRELHRNGIEVILDMVYNHTAKKALPDFYYLKEDFSGCGNTLNANHPIVHQLILDSLHYFAKELQVDGFRFDLAATLKRDCEGKPMQSTPILEAISKDLEVKLIAEPWDAFGFYQVGDFYPTTRWSEWNGQYRDSVRRFLRGQQQERDTFATRLCGSQDLYKDKSPICSINFVTCHDGFTLHDLVSYNEKHNMENGENNRDGSDQNESWDCGPELRERQMRNFILALMISQGVPMLSMGDEYGHTKHGNNNTWCQDNERSWFLWDRKTDPFFKQMIQLRKDNPEFRLGRFLTDQDITWHVTNWQESSGFLAFTLGKFYIAFNASPEKRKIELPPGNWRFIVNTGESTTMEPFSAILLQKVVVITPVVENVNPG